MRPDGQRRWSRAVGRIWRELRSAAFVVAGGAGVVVVLAAGHLARICWRWLNGDLQATRRGAVGGSKWPVEARWRRPCSYSRELLFWVMAADLRRGV
jgi:hypothetical protein